MNIFRKLGYAIKAQVYGAIFIIVWLCILQISMDLYAKLSEKGKKIFWICCSITFVILLIVHHNEQDENYRREHHFSKEDNIVDRAIFVKDSIEEINEKDNKPKYSMDDFK